MKEADINKTAIISRLKAYRERNGARAYRIVAHYVGSKRISDDVLRAIVSNAYRISDEAWMRIDATLDDLEKYDRVASQGIPEEPSSSKWFAEGPSDILFQNIS